MQSLTFQLFEKLEKTGFLQKDVCYYDNNVLGMNMRI